FDPSVTIAENQRDNNAPRYFYSDHITYTPIGGVKKQLYFAQQSPSFAWSKTNVPGVDGLTAAQVYAKYGLAFGGVLAPSDAVGNSKMFGGTMGSVSADPGFVFTWTASMPHTTGVNIFAYLNQTSPAATYTLTSGPVTINLGWNLVTVT